MRYSIKNENDITYTAADPDADYLTNGIFYTITFPE
jgi:hypothetical protein